MKTVYIAVPCDYFLKNPWPPMAKDAASAMSIIWDMPGVEFIRNNHPLGDLYRLIVDSEQAITAMVLRSPVGTIVTDVNAKY